MSITTSVNNVSPQPKLGSGSRAVVFTPSLPPTPKFTPSCQTCLETATKAKTLRFLVAHCFSWNAYQEVSSRTPVYWYYSPWCKKLLKKEWQRERGRHKKKKIKRQVLNGILTVPLSAWLYLVKVTMQLSTLILYIIAMASTAVNAKYDKLVNSPFLFYISGIAISNEAL